jgi:LacI family transcriptional regulator
VSVNPHGWLYQSIIGTDIPFNENLIIKIEDVDTCEIIGKLLEDKAIDAVFAVNELFAVTIIKTAKK